ncbi:hypothetical protein SPBR_07873 [Sporothrix brasiliensis 5110]|uniref:Uncharacterized protein n=1 Tax=Sporothrix brasiliensis 5110 TaxID=1398154 RepID=A0A0C2IRV5_9PEZI|nr:uncharacterized protein SPBR_07873 [Sporothrix brasiliensis 5110]KIH89610.1 hypothetical protein SPBR_07873 [Sporothrix brasiliensis 5110]
MDTRDKIAKRTTTTTYWTRRYVFACDHAADRYYPVKDICNNGNSPRDLIHNVPFLLPLRVGRECSACLRRQVFDRVQAKAAEVRASFNMLRAMLDQRSMASDDGLDTPLLIDDDAGADDDDEVWPEQPPTLESLSRLYATVAETQVTATPNINSYGTTKSSIPGRPETLSERIRSLREDLERRRQAWETSSKLPKTEPVVETLA